MLRRTIIAADIFLLRSSGPRELCPEQRRAMDGRILLGRVTDTQVTVATDAKPNNATDESGATGRTALL